MRISDWSSDVCSSDLIADRYLDRTQLAQRKPTEHVIQTIRKQNCDHVALGDAMRGQAMCQTIHPDVDRGKAQRLAVILPRQERTITDRLRLMLQHGRQRPLRTIEMRLKMLKGQYLLSCIVHRYPLSIV